MLGSRGMSGLQSAVVNGTSIGQAAPMNLAQQSPARRTRHFQRHYYASQVPPDCVAARDDAHPLQRRHRCPGLLR